MKREAHTLSGAYALDSLDKKDRARFERHLGRCDDCVREVRELRETTARLASATAVSPPAEMKERLLAAAVQIRQHVPAPRVGYVRGRFVVAGACAVAAALVVLTVIFGLSDSDANQRLDQMQQRSQAIAAVLTAHDATIMTGQVTGGGTATIVMSHRERALVFTVSGLHPLPSSSGYELWLMGPSGPRPVGMLPAGSHGMAGPVIAAGLRAGDHLVLTVEPAAGMRHPTSPMMLDITL